MSNVASKEQPHTFSQNLVNKKITVKNCRKTVAIAFWT